MRIIAQERDPFQGNVASLGTTAEAAASDRMRYASPCQRY
jgi:hypothetical protein